ncbi:hypothetical protein B0I18_10483 [Taibaiella chishuiensis]|uniref:Uncharacterized protein n=1 Tax=Taibaiella chishuiensis TaxID=1434707 RepID=A0A2P8D491_9BACT|nr:hypothetical protein B0I18_10483 [Taibaiella chishuiensis]
MFRAALVFVADIASYRCFYMPELRNDITPMHNGVTEVMFLILYSFLF